MNRLTQRPPVSVAIGGKEHKLNTDFRDCLKTVVMLNDTKLLDTEKQDIFLYNLYEPDYPADTVEAVKQGIWFLRCGKETESKASPILFNFEIDADMICAAYLKAGINLDVIENMHWWTFMSMFAELPESLFNRVVYLRSKIQRREKLTKDEREQCNRIGLDVINMTSAEELERKQEDKAYFEDKLKKFDKR